jgi:UTP:GlnB (protein PII) uridylyltransferase
MKRDAAIKILEANEIFFLRHGANHDVFIHRPSGKKIAFPRHDEFSNNFIKKLLKQKPE